MGLSVARWIHSTRARVKEEISGGQSSLHPPADGKLVALHVDLDEADTSAQIALGQEVVDRGHHGGNELCGGDAGFPKVRGQDSMIAVVICVPLEFNRSGALADGGLHGYSAASQVVTFDVPLQQIEIR